MTDHVKAFEDWLVSKNLITRDWTREYETSYPGDDPDDFLITHTATVMMETIEAYQNGSSLPDGFFAMVAGFQEGTERGHEHYMAMLYTTAELYKDLLSNMVQGHFEHANCCLKEFVKELQGKEVLPAAEEVKPPTTQQQ